MCFISNLAPHLVHFRFGQLQYIPELGPAPPQAYVKARYSNGDSNRSYVFYPDYPDRELRELRQLLLLLRAAVGVAKDFGSYVGEETRSLTKPPGQSSGVLFDSVQGGPHRPSCSGPGHCDSRMVLYDLTQAYPEYIATYRVREKRGWLWQSLIIRWTILRDGARRL